MLKELLIQTLSLQSESGREEQVIEFVQNFCEKNELYYEMDEMSNIYIIKGEADLYPCFVAHMDTVQDIVENKTVIELEGCLFAMNAFTMDRIDIGGDDLVGVFICLQALLKLDVCKVALYREEETGCTCSYESDISFFDNVSMGLQFDRNGNSGFVINAAGTDLSSKEFQDTILPTINQFKYKFIRGGMTDVMALKELGVSCPLANIECGYYNPHSSESFVVIQHVENALNLGLEIIKNYGNIYFTPHQHIFVKTYSKQDYKWYEDYESKFIGSMWEKDEQLLCSDCYKPVDEWENDEMLCDECFDYYYEYDEKQKIM